MLLLSFVVSNLLASPAAPSAEWSQWRGPRLTGASPETGLPLKWGKEENVVWKLALPSWSAATPIVWGERIFLNVADGDSLSLWCVERGKGTLAWKRPLGAGNVKSMEAQHVLAVARGRTASGCTW